MKNSTLIETGNSLKECGYGNQVYSNQGFHASFHFKDLTGPKRDLQKVIEGKQPQVKFPQPDIASPDEMHRLYVKPDL
jgi:hypothetical protein